jgi:hypothetical protein
MYRTTFKRLSRKLDSTYQSRFISGTSLPVMKILSAHWLSLRWLLLSKLSLGLLFACLLLSCVPDKQQHDYSIFTFGTIIDVTIYNVDRQRADSAFDQLQSMFDEFHQNWSPWTNGDLAQLNKQISTATDNTAIEVPEHLVPIIKASIT